MDLPLLEILSVLGQNIKARRVAMKFTQKTSAERAGVAYRTWRRMESQGKASIEDLVRAAIALRCEQGISTLFPEPVANSMDELLIRQRVAAEMERRKKIRKARL